MYTPVETRKTLSELVASRVKASTHGRIRNLSVHEVKGMVVVRGHVPSHHTKQMALHGALEVLSGEQMSAEITVGCGRSEVRN